ncbi:MAG: MobA-like NTP transferase domain containing protein, partial [Planctomycetota bacterium]
LSTPLLVTTADHAFLRGEIVDDFCRRAAAAADVDLWVGVVRHQSVQVLFPGLKKTAHKLRGEAWCGCNLFYFASKDSRRAAELWRRAEKDRKRPWRIARTIGWRFLLSFLLGRHSLEQTLDHIGKKLGIRIRALELPFPEASVDVDSVEDWKIVEQLIKNCASASTP